MDTIATLPIDPLLKAVLALTIPVLGYFVGAWLTAHQTQVDAATATIADQRLKETAEMAVRSVEQAPATASKSGLEQRHAAVAIVATRLGIPAPLAEVAVDALFHTLVAAGQIQAPAPPPLMLPSVTPGEPTPPLASTPG